LNFGSRTARAALFGAALAGIITGWPLLFPALTRLSLLGLATVLIAIAGGAAAGAMVAGLYQVLGRLRLWALVLVLSLASLVIVVTTTDVRRDGTLLIEAGLCVAGGLSLWVLSAYGLHAALRCIRSIR
jgi:hypothetical protein